MKNFFRTDFKLSLFDILFLLACTGLKYLALAFMLHNKIKFVFVWFCFVAFFFLIPAYGIIGTIENKGHSFESWTENARRYKSKALLIQVVKWGRIPPLVFGYLLFLYLMGPTSPGSFFLLLAIINIRNIISFFIKKQPADATATKAN